MAAEPTALSARACRQPDSKRSTFAHCAHLKASRAPLPVRRAQARLLTPRGQASDATGIRAHCVRYLTERRRQGSRIAWLATDPSKFDNLNRFVLTPFECWSVGERCTHCKRSGRECPLLAQSGHGLLYCMSLLSTQSRHLTGYSVGTPAGRHYARRGRIDPDRGRRNRARAPQVVARLLFTRGARSAGPG